MCVYVCVCVEGGGGGEGRERDHTYSKHIFTTQFSSSGHKYDVFLLKRVTMQ